MNEELRTRYSRQIKLPHIGELGQQKLVDSHALIVGLGGLGSPAALYLAAAGVGKLTLCDFDQVDLSNLQRQIIHNTDDIGELKAESAKKSLLALNPEITIETIDYLAEEEELQTIASLANVILDCTDNFPSRFGLNRISQATNVPLVSGAGIRWEGQIATFDPNQADSPCYQCLYPQSDLESASCAMEGVIAPLVGVIGTMQAQEALNVLLGKPALVGKLNLFDARRMEWQAITLKKNPKCPICGH